MNTDSILFVYESIQLSAHGILDGIKLLKGKYHSIQIVINNLIGPYLELDQTDSFRYYIYHNSGVHAVYLPWIESTKKSITSIGMCVFPVYESISCQ